MGDYLETKNYWNEVYAELGEYDISRKIRYDEIEKAIQWVSINSTGIIDFGCGIGRALFRCLEYGAPKGCGIDISEKAISLAKKVEEINNLGDKVEFACGGLTELKKIKHNVYDGGILFNILDNLRQDEGRKLIDCMYGVLKPNGKVIVKLNPYMSQQELRRRSNLKAVSSNLYKDDGGQYIWNISNNEFKKLTEAYFKIEKYEEIILSNKNSVGRIYYLIKNTI